VNGNRGEPLTELIARWSEAARVILNGDLRTYAGLAKHSSEYLLMPPNGGDPRRGFDGSDEAAAWWAQTFRDGQADVEVFGAYTSGDLAVLVAVERQHGTVGELPSQDLSMRITLVFRRRATNGGCCTDTPTPSPGPSIQISWRRLLAGIMPLWADHPRW
jgi:ketosteroid isomerase-like protein